MSANERGDCYASEMTIREKIAAMAMQGVATVELNTSSHSEWLQLVASASVNLADALLAELAKPQGPRHDTN